MKMKMKMKKQAPVYFVKNDYSKSEAGKHPRVIVLVQEVDCSPTVDGGRKFREVLSKEVHVDSGENIFPSRSAALAAVGL
jgi:hypothetical protein